MNDYRVRLRVVGYVDVTIPFAKDAEDAEETALSLTTDELNLPEDMTDIEIEVAEILED